MNATTTTPLFIGIDWADQRHAVCLYDPLTNEYTLQEVAHHPSALHEWGSLLAPQYPGRPLLVCLEQSRGSLVLALNAMSAVTCYPINPKSLARYREARFPSRSKNDPKDARLLCDYLRHHLDELRPMSPPDRASARLGYLTEHRRKLVDERTRQLNRLRAELKVYFPHALEWFGGVDSPVLWRFLLKWPTLEKVQRARSKTIMNFLYANQVRRGKLVKQLPEDISKAVALHQDEVVIETSSLLVESLCHLLLSLQTAIQKYDRLIDEALKAHPERWLVQDLPGAGPQLQPRLLAAFGSNRTRYPNSEILAQLAGIAPVCETSGNQHWVHFRWAASNFLRQSFHEFALHSLAKSVWARNYYEAARTRGKSHHVAVRAIAFKWIRILHACWISGKPYDEEAYLQRLQTHGSPYAKAA
jgi:transposase